jgi:uncharacterized membrane protein
MVGPGHRFKPADTAQQIVGGFLLAGPFVVTEEVWTLALGMSGIQTASTVIIVLAVGYGTLYKADDRDPESEAEVGGVPVRFLSLVTVAYVSVVLLALAFDAPGTFLAGETDGPLGAAVVTFRAASVGAVFSVIGAATADTLF